MSEEAPPAYTDIDGGGGGAKGSATSADAAGFPLF